MIVPSASSSYFNPLPRKEGDDADKQLLLQNMDISIHSLVKRETRIQQLAGSHKIISIHSLVKRET